MTEYGSEPSLCKDPVSPAVPVFVFSGVSCCVGKCVRPPASDRAPDPSTGSPWPLPASGLPSRWAGAGRAAGGQGPLPSWPPPLELGGGCCPSCLQAPVGTFSLENHGFDLEIFLGVVVVSDISPPRRASEHFLTVWSSLSFFPASIFHLSKACLPHPLTTLFVLASYSSCISSCWPGEWIPLLGLPSQSATNDDLNPETCCLKVLEAVGPRSRCQQAWVLQGRLSC